MCRYFFTLFLVLLMCVPISAGEHGFETTSEGIVDALTHPALKKTSGTRSWGRITPSSRAIKVVRKDQGKTIEETVVVREGPASQSVNLKIEFDSNSYTIRPGSFKLLKELGKALTSDKLKVKRFILKGHADSDGPDAYNLTLSHNRALSVQNYLVGNFGLSPDRIRVVGYGEAMPLVPNTTAQNKQLNRRVEVQALP